VENKPRYKDLIALEEDSEPQAQVKVVRKPKPEKPKAPEKKQPSLLTFYTLEEREISHRSDSRIPPSPLIVEPPTTIPQVFRTLNPQSFLMQPL
jgi:hypothetical protein